MTERQWLAVHATATPPVYIANDQHWRTVAARTWDVAEARRFESQEKAEKWLERYGLQGVWKGMCGAKKFWE